MFEHLFGMFWKSARFISHLLRVSWVAAFAQHTFCFSHTTEQGSNKQRNQGREQTNKQTKKRIREGNKLECNILEELHGLKLPRIQVLDKERIVQSVRVFFFGVQVLNKLNTEYQNTK